MIFEPLDIFLKYILNVLFVVGVFSALSQPHLYNFLTLQLPPLVPKVVVIIFTLNPVIPE